MSSVFAILQSISRFTTSEFPLLSPTVGRTSGNSRVDGIGLPVLMRLGSFLRFPKLPWCTKLVRGQHTYRTGVAVAVILLVYHNTLNGGVPDIRPSIVCSSLLLS